MTSLNTGLLIVQDGPVELLPFLYLGSAIHSSRKETLAASGITAVLNVSSTCPNFYEGELEYLRLTVEDSLAADIRACFSTAIAFIGESWQKLYRIVLNVSYDSSGGKWAGSGGKSVCRGCSFPTGLLITQQQDYDKL